jgi:hypothetical protein
MFRPAPVAAFNRPNSRYAPARMCAQKNPGLLALSGQPGLGTGSAAARLVRAALGDHCV